MHKKQKLKKYLAIGGGIGMLIGFIVFLIGFNLTFDEWYYASIGFPFLLSGELGRIIGFDGWSILIPYFVGGMILYVIFGLTLSALIYHVKK